MAKKDNIVSDNIRTNTIKRELYPYTFNNGIHALSSTNTGSLYVGNGLAQLYKYLDLEASNIITGWTPAPEDIGLSTDTVQHFIFHIQDYIYDYYSVLVSKYGAVNGNHYNKCLALINQSDSYIYLDYEAYYNGIKEQKVLKDKLIPEMFFTDKAGNLCYDYSIGVGDLDKVDIYIHQFYLAVIPRLDYSTVGCSIKAETLIEVGGNNSGNSSN